MRECDNSKTHIATRCRIDGPVSNPGVVTFSVPYRPASATTYNGYRVFPGVKRTQSDDNHPPPYSAEVTNGLELYLRLPSVPAKA